MDTVTMRQTCERLTRRLTGEPSWAELRAVYLELAPLVGQLQGAVGEAERRHETSDELRAAREALERLKASTRQVGRDIRLASPAALALGLGTSLEEARGVLTHLERLLA